MTHAYDSEASVVYYVLNFIKLNTFGFTNIQMEKSSFNSLFIYFFFILTIKVPALHYGDYLY